MRFLALPISNLHVWRWKECMRSMSRDSRGSMPTTGPANYWLRTGESQFTAIKDAHHTEHMKQVSCL